MIWTVEQLKSMQSFKDVDVEVLQIKMDSIEQSIRSYTNNNFQNRNVRLDAPSISGVLFGSSPFIKKGDTIQISQSKVNDGLYVVEDLIEDGIKVDKPIFDTPTNRITKIEYPADVRSCALDMLKYDLTIREKTGVSSETISRHSVSYAGDSGSSNGYPSSMIGVLNTYRKVRF